MKKSLLSLSLFAFVLSLTMYIVSCQKDNVQTEVQDAAITQTLSGEEVSDRGPLILATSVTPDCACAQRACNVVGPITIGNKFNGIRIVLNNVTHNYYNIPARGGLTYTIRQGGGCNGAVVASFNCFNSTVEYFNAALADNTVYSLQITNGPSSSPCYAFTTSNCRTQSCNSDSRE